MPLTGSEQSLRERWQGLCSEFLPLGKPGTIWRYSRPFLPTDSNQGWKIHISATILTACEVLAIVGPYLKERDLAFKAPATLEDLSRLNSGLWPGYGQVGKFVTVYPSDERAFREIVPALFEMLPRRVPAPAVPFDLRFRESNIYYRYGSFSSNRNEPARIQLPGGTFVKDDRSIAKPDWVGHPLPEEIVGTEAGDSPLATRYRVFRSITQRGKGGVYEAIDLEPDPPRVRILKEGRRNGETDWDGRDGWSRMENEKLVLQELGDLGIEVPGVLDSFDVGDQSYLVLEKIEGRDLFKLLAGRKRRLPIRETLYICKQIARLVARIHAAKWVWRDCKPANLFLTPEKTVRPIDFEGACRIGDRELVPWSTPNYAAPEVIGRSRGRIGPDAHASAAPTYAAEDLYALGICLFFMIEGHLPSETPKYSTNLGAASAAGIDPGNPKVQTGTRYTRRNVPTAVREIIRGLLSVEPELRPPAREVFEVLQAS